MADYYPLIARAVAGLEKNTGDGRRTLYERARQALVAQLRGVTPALNESDITRERLALEEAIRKVEAEAARKARSESVREPAAKVRAPDASRWEAAGRWEDPPPTAEPTTPPMPPRRSGGTSLRSDPSARRGPPAPNAGETRSRGAAGMLGNERQLHPVFDEPAAPAEQTEQGDKDDQAELFPAAPVRSRMPEHRSLLDAGLQDFHGVVSESEDLGEASALAARSARDSYDAFPSRPTDLDRHGVQMLEPHALQPSLQDYDADTMHEPLSQAETLRPPPLRGRSGRAIVDENETAAPRRSYRDYIHVGIALALLLAVCGVFAWQWPNMAAFYRNLRAPPTSQTADGNAPTSQSASKFPDRVESGGQAQQQSDATTPNPTPNASGAAVAQRVVLYEEDPPNPEVKRYAGSAIWRTEMVSPGAGRAPELAVRADVEIPERGITMTWSLRRNTDPSLPASHTVEIMFKLPKDFAPGGISNVPGMLMKQGEEARGIPIAGMAVKVTNGYFLIGLSAVEADKDRNIQLLKERPWFDIMLVYNNNRRAILAIEKGAPGEAVFEQAFAAWAKQG
jgi:hypothetical protein